MGWNTGSNLCVIRRIRELPKSVLTPRVHDRALHLASIDVYLSLHLYMKHIANTNENR